MKKILVIGLAVALILAGCASPDTGVPGADAPAPGAPGDTPAAANGADTALWDNTGGYDSAGNWHPPIDLDSSEVFGIGPFGEMGYSTDVLALSDDDLERLREGNFRVAIAHHMLGNQVNYSKSAATQNKLQELGVEVVAVTDAGFSADQLVSDLETVMALNPDVIISMPMDPVALASTFRRVSDAGIGLIFQQNVPDGFELGDNYILVKADSYGHGVWSARAMAAQLGYEGRVAMFVFDTPFFTTNERDRAFIETMEREFPLIEIVEIAGWTDMAMVGTVADGVFARFPDLDGAYASWAAPAASVVASALSAGMNDIVITATDMDADTAIMIFESGLIRGSGVPQSYYTGVAEALAAAHMLLGNEVPQLILTPSVPVTPLNVPEAWTRCFNVELPPGLVDAMAARGN